MSNKFHIARILNLCLIWVSILCYSHSYLTNLTFSVIYSSISHDSVSSHVCLFLFSFLSKLKFMSNKTHIPGILILYCIWYFHTLYILTLNDKLILPNSFISYSYNAAMCAYYKSFFSHNWRSFQNLSHIPGVKNLCHIWVSILGCSHNIWQITLPNHAFISYSYSAAMCTYCSHFFYHNSS